MSTEENKALIRRWTEEGWNKGNFELAEEVFAPDMVSHNAPPGAASGFEGWKQGAMMLRSAFPDSKNTIEDMLAEGDRVAWRWSSTGTHQGPFFGVPPTGKQVSVTGTNIVRIAEGRIVELWQSWDALGLMQQIRSER
jgi:steroid delta-isomerase-like uncharacterized protein